jgi:hypothetical protein
MGKVDISSLYRCGDRMNGVLIEWSVWLGIMYTILFSIFYLFFLLKHTHHYLQNICIPYTYCCGDTINLDKTGQKKE